MGHLAQLWKQKKTRIYVGNSFRSYENNYGVYKENIKFMSLIGSVMFNDSFGVKNCIYWTY